MCIIYKMKNSCLCCLFLVTVDIIRDWLPQVTELPFCAGIELGRFIAPSTVFSQPYGKKWSFGVLFMVSRVNAYSELIWCTGTLITYHMYLLWHDVITYVTWVGKWHHSTLFLKFVSCVIIWYKNVPLETSMESFKGKPFFFKFALYFNQCVLQKDSITENISMDIFSLQFYQKCYNIRCIKWCKC